MMPFAKSIRPERILILSGLFLFFIFCTANNAQVSGQLSRDQLNSELRKSLEQNDVAGIVALIKENRLLIKPFVDGLIKESITAELRGNTKEAAKLKTLGEKAAENFENTFGEKSLSIAVKYLTVWNKDQKKSKLVADSLYALGTNLRTKEPEKAANIYQQAIEIYKNIGDERGVAEILGGFGLIYSSTDGEKSMNYYQEALKAREKVDDKVLIGNSLNSIGSVNYSFLKNYQQAIVYYGRAELIRKEIGDLPNLSRTLTNKAQAYEKLAQPEQALTNYRKSFEISRQSGDQARMAESQIKIGAILINLGKYPEALNNLENALKINRDLNNARGISDALNQIGFAYLKMGDYNTALGKFNESIKITKEQNDLWGLAGAYNNLAITLQNAGRTEKALEYYKNALAIYEDQKDQASVLISLNNIGTTYFDLKDYHTAEEYHKIGLKISRELQIRDQEADYLLNLANDQNLLGKSDTALINYKAGFEIARTLNNPDLTWRFIEGTAEAYKTSGEYGKVVELNDTALKILEGLRNTLPGENFKTTFMARQFYVYEDNINLLEMLHEKDKTKGYDLLAFRYAEQSKSRALLDLLAESIKDINKSEININDHRYEELQQAKPVSLEEVQSMCTDKNTVILEYALGDSSSCMWIITSKEHKFLKLPDRKKLAEQIETIRFALLDPQQGISEFFTQAGSSLYNELIKPAEPFLSKKSKLVIIPDGVLTYLPFEALLTENIKPVSETTYSSIPFLVKKYPVSYGQSSSVLKTLISQHGNTGEKAPKSKRLFAFGDPLYEDTLYNSHVKFHRLEFSGKEIENIASFFPEGYAEIYLRNKATEENLKRNNSLNTFNYIHFATHGLINEDKPDLSSLVITSEINSGEDGFLQASEIFNLKLNADLVVLSACQTGLGKLVRGEGMVGLTRAFMYAGTPSVVVSLWSVSDFSTSILMGEFYKNLIKNNLTKTDALRKAQLSLIGDPKYSHPFYWAPFILVGDWR
jgi:CHAT domain-containing protein/Tfp pilus assembly protein PilF